MTSGDVLGVKRGGGVGGGVGGGGGKVSVLGAIYQVPGKFDPPRSREEHFAAAFRVFFLIVICIMCIIVVFVVVTLFLFFCVLFLTLCPFFHRD